MAGAAQVRHSFSRSAMNRRNFSALKVQFLPIRAAPGNSPLAAIPWTVRGVIRRIAATSDERRRFGAASEGVFCIGGRLSEGSCRPSGDKTFAFQPLKNDLADELRSRQRLWPCRYGAIERI
jgi:hypothetical protein